MFDQLWQRLVWLPDHVLQLLAELNEIGAYLCDYGVSSFLLLFYSLSLVENWEGSADIILESCLNLGLESLGNEIDLLLFGLLVVGGVLREAIVINLRIRVLVASFIPIINVH